MKTVTLYDFLSGAVAFGFFVCGLFFLRFWRRTRDELFMAFALAFGLLGRKPHPRMREAHWRGRCPVRRDSVRTALGPAKGGGG